MLLLQPMKTFTVVSVACVMITSALFLGCPVPEEPETPKVNTQNPNRIQGGMDTTEKVMDKPAVIDETLPQPAKEPSKAPAPAKAGSGQDDLEKPIPWGPDVMLSPDAGVPPPQPMDAGARD